MPELIDVEPGSPQWLAARQAGVTATDMVTVLGLSSHESVYSLYWRKLGAVPPQADSDRLRLGRVLEAYIADRWADERQIPPAHRHGARSALYRGSDPWQMATPDRVFYDEPVELKSWADADKSSWDGGPPPAVRVQVLWQMDVLDAGTGHCGVLFLPSGRFMSFTVAHAHDGPRCGVCADLELMRAEGETFYRRMRLELPPPAPDASLASLAAVRARWPAAVEGPAAEVDETVFAAWSDARDLRRHWEQKARGYEAVLREQIGAATRVKAGGRIVARRVICDAQVKAHTRHQDYIRILGGKGNGDE